MANMTTQPESIDSLPADLLLTRQNGADVVVSVANFLNARYPVGGQPIITLTDINPALMGYPGTWVALGAGSSLNSVDTGDGDLGTVTGSNDPTVPVSEHNHTGGTSSNGDHNHTGTTSTDSHYHIQGEGSVGTGERYGSVTGQGNSLSDEPYEGQDNDRGRRTSTDSHSHTFTSSTNGNHSHTFTTNNTGTSGATLNVQGQVLNVVIWIRTA